MWFYSIDVMRTAEVSHVVSIIPDRLLGMTVIVRQFKINTHNFCSNLMKRNGNRKKNRTHAVIRVHFWLQSTDCQARDNLG